MCQFKAAPAYLNRLLEVTGMEQTDMQSSEQPEFAFVIVKGPGKAQPVLD